MPEQNKPHKVLRGSAAWYPAVRDELTPDDPRRWALTSDIRIALFLYSDNTIHVLKRSVRHQLRVRTRPELLVLTSYLYTKLESYFLAVDNADWVMWQQQILAAGDPSQLPKLAHRHWTSGGSLAD